MQCPCCDLPLRSETVGGEALEQCDGCVGQFSSHQSLRRLLATHASGAGAQGTGYVRPSPLSDPVRYRRCPACGEMMLRKNFKESSGIIVDVCSAHGVWFDRGELAMVFEFAMTGAMAKAEHDTTERADARRRLDAWEQDLRAAGPRHYIGGFGGPAGGPVEWIADITRVVPGIDPADEDD